MELKEKALYLEYFRINNNISINKFINKEYRICSLNTYTKIKNGDEVKNDILDDLCLANNIKIEENEKALQEYINLGNVLYNSLLYLKLDHKEDVQNTIHTLENKYDFYPYLIMNEFIALFYEFYFNKERFEIKTINKFKPISIYFPKHIQILFWYMYYETIYIKTLDTESIVNASKEIPIELYQNPIVLRILMDVYKYLDNMERSLSLAKELEQICIENNNYNMLAIVYLNYHGIYNSQNLTNKADNYLKCITDLNEDKKLSYFTLYHVQYYIGMHYFNEHEFLNAESVFEKLLNEHLEESKNLVLPYLHVTKNLNTEFVKKVIDYLMMKNPEKTIFVLYFLKKIQKISKPKLKEYLMENVLINLNGNQYFEMHIFLEELYFLGYKEECSLFLKYYTKQGYKLNEKWIEHMR